MARLPIPRVPGRVSVVAGLLFGLGATALGMVDQFWPAFACLAVLGAADTVGTVVRNSVRELITTDELRVEAFYPSDGATRQFFHDIAAAH